MRWRDFDSDNEPGHWKVLDLRVEPRATGSSRPGLHMQAGPAGRMRLMAGEWPLLWARVESDHYGYWYLRRPLAGNSPGLVVPPISALEARSVPGSAGSREWYRSWTRVFARKLLTSPVAPLHAGRWWLVPGDVREGNVGWLPTGVVDRLLASVRHLDRMAAQPPAGYAGWDSLQEPLALRPFSAPDDARVRAWRRALREGSLPPALLMWASGLDRYIILDGHDRITAALAEDRLPALLVLCHLQEQARGPDAASGAQMTEVVARQLAASRSPDLRPKRPFRIETANRLLIDAFDDRPYLWPVSRAWRLEGGARRWRSEVARVCSDLVDADVRRGLLSTD